MAAEVSSAVRMVGGGYKDEGGEETTKSKRDLITKDLLGGCAENLDLNLLSSKTSYKEVSGTVLPCPLQDLNLLPEDSAALDLKLVSSSTHYQSVCTLDKVKLALERAAARESQSSLKRRRSPEAGSPSPPSSSTTAEETAGVVSGSTSSAGLAAAGCPSCLLYVLISRGNPRCPRCDSRVPLPPAANKKPRIDLNSSSS